MATPSERIDAFTEEHAMTHDYDWSTFEIHTYYAASLERVWQAWSSADGLASFFIARAEHTSSSGGVRDGAEQVAAGDRYRWTFCHPFVLEGEFRAVAPLRSVSFSFGGMETTVDLTQTGDAVLVRLRQTGCRTEDPGRANDHLNCRSCWIFFLTNLKSVLEHGADLRDHEHAERNDSLSIHYVPACCDSPDSSV